ncbi:MAG TPA: DUF5681 domain-containing protein [Stellaceae bacterium]|nr:DUF5681 domain-containing protein [Stellaceae bacterium]
MPDESKEYTIGFGRPPRRTQWQRGTSGNKKGRPRGSKNLSTILKEVFAEKVPVKKNKGKSPGKAGLISKLEAAVRRLVDRAIAGDQNQQRQLIQLAQWFEQRSNSLPAPEIESLSNADREVIALLHARLRLHDGGSEDE